MIVLDENVFESQRRQLLKWRIHVCQIGRDVGRKRMPDDQILTLLRQQRRPTFITRDRDFFKKQLCGDRFCLAYLDVHPLQLAKFVRRLLRHREFKSWSQRRGCVLRVANRGISTWRIRVPQIGRYDWVDS